MQSPGAHVCRERMLKLGPHLLQLRSSPHTPRAGGRPDQQDLAVALHAQQWTTNRETEMSAICMELAAVRFGRGAAHKEAVCSCHDFQGVILRLDLLSGHCGLCLRSVYYLDIPFTLPRGACRSGNVPRLAGLASTSPHQSRVAYRK